MTSPEKRILIVSPNFPPVNAPDMHRVRLLLPFLRQFGWDAEVLALDPGMLHAPRDNWMAGQLPPEIPVHMARGLGLPWARIPGFGSAGVRGLRALDRTAQHLLRQRPFDLVYFSTTVFEVHILGPRWKKSFGVPFAMDFQDPWVNDYYRDRPHLVPPGGRFKYALADRLNRLLEPGVVRECAGLTAVSDAYLAALRNRYPGAAPALSLVAPFPGSAVDFERVESSGVSQSEFDPHDGNIHWVYIGASGPFMEKSLRAIFRAVAESAPADLRARLRMSFIGTSYAPAGARRNSVTPLAAEYGLASCVRENTPRIPYSTALRCLLDAHALIVPGSDDAAYNASKIYPYLLARRPLLAVFHRDSPVVELLQSAGGACCVPFAPETGESALASRIAAQWFHGEAYSRVAPFIGDGIRPFSDREHARRLCEFFDEAIASQ